MIKTQENIALGKKIKELRELKGLTQEQLSIELGMSQTHISQVEQGVKGFSRKTLKAAADILNTTIGYLLGEIDSPDLPPANITNEDMENEREPIALRIAESRKKLGLSQAQFAQIHGFALPTFARWEVGKTEPKASDIKALARALNVSVAFLLGENMHDEQENLMEEERINQQGDILTEDILFKHDSTELVFKKGTNVNSISKVIEQVNKGLSISRFPTDEESNISLKPAAGGDTSS